LKLVMLSMVFVCLGAWFMLLSPKKPLALYRKLIGLFLLWVNCFFMMFDHFSHHVQLFALLDKSHQIS
jgi:hypothetical protein